MLNKVLPLFALALGLSIGLGACAHTTVNGPRGEELTLMAPADQTLRRGETNKVSVFVRRDKISGPVTLKIDNLPSGVEVIEKSVSVPGDSMSTEFTLYAKPNADLVSNHAVRVTAIGPDNIQTTEWFDLDVKQPGGVLGL